MQLKTLVINQLGTLSLPEKAYISGLVALIEKTLASHNIIFGENQKTIQKTYDEFLDTFDIPLASFLTNVTIKRYDDSYTEVLTENVDYITQKKAIEPNPIYRIKLLKKEIKLPTYLEIVGNFSLSNEYPEDFVAVIVDVLKEYLTEYKNSKSNIKSKRIGDISISYNTTSTNTQKPKISQHPTILSLIDVYHVF